MSDKDLFNRHTQPPMNGSIFDYYIIDGVIEAPAKFGGQFRSVVLAVHHRDDATKRSLVAKIVFRNSVVTEDDILREISVHYFLTQNDAEAVRKAARDHKEGDGLFVVSDPPDADNKNVRDAIRKGKTHNIVPLLDYWMGDFARKDLRPWSADAFGVGLLNDIPERSPFRVGVLIQDRFKITLFDHLTDVRPGALIRHTYWLLLVIMCQLHPLLALRFSHGDLHAKNVGIVENPGERHYVVGTTNQVLNVPQDVPQPMLFDFGFSHMQITDAAGRQRVYRPSNSLTRARVRQSNAAEDYTFSPSFDLFRSCQSFAQLLAARVRAINNDNDIQTILNSPDLHSLRDGLKFGLGQGGLSSAEDALFGFVDSLTKTDNVDKIKTAASKLASRENEKAQDELWVKRLRETRTKMNVDDVMRGILPLQVVDKLNPKYDGAGQGKDADMTIRPMYKPGHVYNPPKPPVDGVGFHPLRLFIS